MNRSVPVGVVRDLGDRALLVGVRDAATGRELARELARELVGTVGPPEASSGEGGCEIVVGHATVMVALDSPDAELDQVRQLMHEVAGRAAAHGDHELQEVAGKLITVPSVFDGPDLNEVAAISGWTPAEISRMMTARPLTVAVVGFSPGFAYLDGVPEPLQHVPRRARPRPAVPPGSVALANGQAAVYPTGSPGGWQLIGRTGVSMFSPWEPPYSRLVPGDLVQFTVATGDDSVEPPPPVAPAWSAPASARQAFEVLQPGLYTVMQDGGRRSVAASGVPAAGPADPVSFGLANRLVGNPAEAGALEITARGPALRCLGPSHVAVVGGVPDIRLDGQVAAAGQVLPVAVGQVLEIGALRQGIRTYAAVAGGFVGPTMFGSMSSDQLCGLGPGSVTAGQRLLAGPWTPPLGDHLGAAPAGTEAGAPIVLRVVPGPHPEWFAADVLRELSEALFTVEHESNRVGLRLKSEGGDLRLRSAHRDSSELDPQGMVTGAVQVPPGGDPVVLMPDHATLGGYPVVAVVAVVDHGRLGQCAPGDTVQFVPIDQAQALRERLLQHRVLKNAVIGHYPFVAG